MLDFLTLKPETFGLDISDLSLKIIQLKKEGEYLGLASFKEAEIKPGIIKEGEIQNEEALAEIIKKALTQVKGKRLRTKHVIASLPEERGFLQVIQMPPMEKKEMEKAVYFEAENYIPLPMEKVYLDSQIVPFTSDRLDHLDVLIAALPQKTVDSYLSVLKKSGLEPLVLEIESQAISRALVKGEKNLEPSLLIDLGETRASFIIFSGSSLRFTSSRPISSREFTESIAQNLKIDFKEAEALKKKYGIDGAKSSKNILRALKPNLIDLVDQIKKYFSYYQTHSAHEHLSPKSKKVGKIILCGGGANLKGLDNFLAQELQLRVILGNPWTNILPDPLREVPELPYSESLRYTTALGLALRGQKL